MLSGNRSYEPTMEEEPLKGNEIQVTKVNGQSQMFLDFAPFEIKTIRIFPETQKMHILTSE